MNAIDERSFNFRKSPSLQHKVRVIVGTQENPISYGVTIPDFIAKQFSGCLLRIYTSGTSIIMESGCKLTPHDINLDKKFCFDGMRLYSDTNGDIKWIK